MTILHLVTDAGSRSDLFPVGPRPSRSRPHLKLVPDTGAAYRSRTSKAGPPRRHSPLTLTVAAAAILAALLTPAAFGRNPDSGAFRAVTSALDII